SLKVAVVTASPPNVAFGGIEKLLFSNAGLSLLNVTSPGPRNLLQLSVTAGVRGRTAPAITLASSAANSVSVTGFPTVPCLVTCCPRGPLMKGPAESKERYGGVLPVASRNGATSHSGSRLPGTCVVFPLAVKVQVSFCLPKSFGTVTVNTPHCLRVRK